MALFRFPKYNYKTKEEEATGVVVKATRTPRPYANIDHKPQQVEVTLELKRGDEDWVIVTKGGVTGYESARLEALESTERGWMACAGCHNWDRLFISHDELHRALKELTTRD